MDPIDSGEIYCVRCPCVAPQQLGALIPCNDGQSFSTVALCVPCLKDALATALQSHGGVHLVLAAGQDVPVERIVEDAYLAMLHVVTNLLGPERAHLGPDLFDRALERFFVDQPAAESGEEPS